MADDASTHTSSQWRVQVEPVFNAAGDRRLTARKYDYNDRMTEEQTGMIETASGAWVPTAENEVHRFTYDKNGNRKTFTDPRGRPTIYAYNQRDRLETTTEPLNRVTGHTYDGVGNKTLTRFPDQETQEWLQYDAFGQAARFIDERGNTTDLSYQWGPMKKLATVTTHRTRDNETIEDQLTTFQSDGIGRPQKTIFPDQSFEEATYEYGGMKTWRTRRGATKTISYDVRGRETAHTWSDATPAVTRSWDDANRLLSLGNIYSGIDYGYDSAGQMRFEGNQIAGSGARVQTDYFRYPSGEVAHLRYPNGFSLRRDYTARGQLQAAGWDDAGGAWVHELVRYHYFPDGKVDHQDFGNDVGTTFGYDPRGMIERVDTHRLSTGQALSDRSYARDLRDRIEAWSKSGDNSLNALENGRGDRYGYDAEGQLEDAWYEALNVMEQPSGAARQDHFAYDELGNRQGTNELAGRGPVAFGRRDNGLNQYLNWSLSASFKYDDQWYGTAGNGVLMQEGWITGSYNALNQPVAMSSPELGSNHMWFGYDPLGRCVKRWIGSSGAAETNPATYYYYEGWNLIQEGPSAGSAERLYVHGGRVDEIVASTNLATGQWNYHQHDARGHAVLLSDGNGTLVEHYEYDAFGKPYFYNNYGQALPNGSAYGNRFLFTGREWLRELRLYDYRNRLYQPELGRFMQPDPIQFAAGDYNLYRYGHNDPINHTDPEGTDLIPSAYSFGRALAVGVAVHLQFIAERRFGQEPDDQEAHYRASGLMAQVGDPFSSFALGEAKELLYPGIDSHLDRASNREGIKEGTKRQLGPFRRLIELSDKRSTDKRSGEKSNQSAGEKNNQKAQDAKDRNNEQPHGPIPIKKDSERR